MNNTKDSLKGNEQIMVDHIFGFGLVVLAVLMLVVELVRIVLENRRGDANNNRRGRVHCCKWKDIKDFEKKDERPLDLLVSCGFLACSCLVGRLHWPGSVEAR